MGFNFISPAVIARRGVKSKYVDYQEPDQTLAELSYRVDQDMSGAFFRLKIVNQTSIDKFCD